MISVLLTVAMMQGQILPWGDGVEKPRGIVSYERSRFTQSIFKLNSQSTIRLVPRNQLLSKWQMSGGMEGIKGWKSTVYKLIPEYHYKWKDYIPVKNSFGYFQMELGYGHTYSDNTEFHDVLTNSETGKVFEHRRRKKIEGEWQSRILFRNVSQRPNSYNGLSVSCASCHNSVDGPGTGGYGSGLVSGSDTVFSDPLFGLER